MAVQQAQRAAEQVDARGDERRPHAVVVEHQRLDEVVGMALVVRRVHDAVFPGRRDGVMQVLGLALDLAQYRIERMLQRAVNRVPLRRAQLVEIGVNPIARPGAAFAISAPQIFDDFLARQYGL